MPLHCDLDSKVVYSCAILAGTATSRRYLVVDRGDLVAVLARSVLGILLSAAPCEMQVWSLELSRLLYCELHSPGALTDGPRPTCKSDPDPRRQGPRLDVSSLQAVRLRCLCCFRLSCWDHQPCSCRGRRAAGGLVESGRATSMSSAIEQLAPERARC